MTNILWAMVVVGALSTTAFFAWAWFDRTTGRVSRACPRDTPARLGGWALIGLIALGLATEAAAGVAGADLLAAILNGALAIVFSAVVGLATWLLRPAALFPPR